MASRAKLFAVAVALFAAFTAVGLYAVRSSGYMDVSELVKLTRPAKVTVKGYLADLRYDLQGGVLYMVLQGRDGSKVLAVVDLNYIEKRYGPIQYIKWDRDNVVVEGVYDPQSHVLRVTNILKGCHSSYSQPAAPRA